MKISPLLLLPLPLLLPLLPLLLFLPLFSACLEIDIPPPEISNPSIASQQSGKNSAGDLHSSAKRGEFFSPASREAQIELRYQGEELRNDDWPKALTISRLFFSSIRNRSGSLVELTQPALFSLLRKKGFFPSLPSDQQSPREPFSGELSSGGLSLEKRWQLEVHFVRHHLLWLPPQEFIQSPNPIRQGEVRLDFRIEMQLWKAGIASASPRQLSWQRIFRSKRSLPALPGTEGEIMALEAHRSLQEWLKMVDESLPDRHSLPDKP